MVSKWFRSRLILKNQYHFNLNPSKRTRVVQAGSQGLQQQARLRAGHLFNCWNLQAVLQHALVLWSLPAHSGPKSMTNKGKQAKHDAEIRVPSIFNLVLQSLNLLGSFRWNLRPRSHSAFGCIEAGWMLDLSPSFTLTDSLGTCPGKSMATGRGGLLFAGGRGIVDRGLENSCSGHCGSCRRLSYETDVMKCDKLRWTARTHRVPLGGSSNLQDWQLLAWYERIYPNGHGLIRTIATTSRHVH